MADHDIASYGQTVQHDSFGTCAAEGPIGPSESDCIAAYSGTTLSSGVAVIDGLQRWEVPSTGDYNITATGAQGASGDPSYVGGLGAMVSGTFSLTAGDVLWVAVGQMGLGQSSGSNGGGGGGSWVVMDDDTPLVIAGGGGGTRTSVDQNGCDATASEFGTTASGDATVWSCADRSDTPGYGGAASSYSWGSGGGGFYSSGGEDCGGAGGSAWVEGVTGGMGSDDTSYGGFGGGGSGQGCAGGGGGGGYSGGEGGRVAGGGGSYNGGVDPVSEIGVGEGDGSVTIIGPLGL